MLRQQFACDALRSPLLACVPSHPSRLVRPSPVAADSRDGVIGVARIAAINPITPMIAAARWGETRNANKRVHFTPTPSRDRAKEWEEQGLCEGAKKWAGDEECLPVWDPTQLYANFCNCGAAGAAHCLPPFSPPPSTSPAPLSYSSYSSCALSLHHTSFLLQVSCGLLLKFSKQSTTEDRPASRPRRLP